MLCYVKKDFLRKMIRRNIIVKKATALILACLFALTAATACTSANPAPPAQNAPAQNNPAPISPATNSIAPSNPAPESPASNFDSSRIIAVYTREDGSGTRDAFVSITGVGGDMYVEAIVNNQTDQILTNVEMNDNAIGYVSVGSLNPNVKALEIDGVTPSDTTIINGSYTLQRPLLVCINADSEQNPLVLDFIDFMLSAEGQNVSATKWTRIDSNAPTYSSGGLSGTLKVGGSTSVDPLMQALSQAYRVHNPSVVIEISGGGSGTGISEATSGVLDIGMSSRSLRDNEKEALRDIDIALDGVAVIVNPANPITGMSIDQVKDIFTGEVKRWSDVG